MRPIKFKGKRVDNGEFVDGDLIHGVNHKSGKMYILPIRGGVMALGHGLDPMDGYEVVPETVCQLIKVVNGVEIYEGDYDEDGNMIDYCEECMGYQFFQIDELKDVIFCHNCDGNFMVQYHLDEFKIVGHIND